MYGFTGFASLDYDILSSKYVNILKTMTEELYNHNSNEEYLTKPHINLGYKRLTSLDKDNSKQPTTYIYGENEYSIVFSGKLYNYNDIREKLLIAGFDFCDYSDTELVLKAFIHYGTDIFKDFNGVFSFAIWNENRQELLIARDHFGIKPLYYTILDKTLIFASEIKSILKYPEVKAIIDKEGICELFGIGPAHTPGISVFKNIYEIKPAHYAIFNKDVFKEFQYWKMETRKHDDDFETTCSKVKYLLEDSINKQIVSDVPLCAMLSGGIDSSILVAYISRYYKENNMSPLTTVSVDYVDNEKNFIKSDFQPNSDNYYIDIMKNTFNTNHRQITIDTPELSEYLKDAMISRDCPGMADVDSSMLLFCKNIKNYSSIAISGECSDEIFAGYPWFFSENTLNCNTFPWSTAISERQNLLIPNISKKIELNDYINFRYNQSIKNIQFDNSDSEQTKQKRIISSLTINWFMQTLIDRADKMSMYNSLELRVPFCDYRLVQYMWNVPWEMKAYNGREKGLLRHIVKDLLPKEIVNRKKSPYPKTHNPTYLNCVKEMLNKIIANANSPINNLLNKEYVIGILNSDGTSISKPWFGQLMTGPQLIAYLCQINMWLEKYNPKIELY